MKPKHFYLIRGLIRESAHWGKFPEMLNVSFPDSRVTMIDLPGSGKNLHLKSPLSINEMVDFMREEYLKVKLDEEEAIAISISLGGMITAMWIKMHSQDFSKAVLINTSFSRTSPFFERLRPEALFYLLKVPFLEGRKKESHILKLVSNHDSVFEETLNLWEKIQKERPVTIKNTLRQLIAAAKFSVRKFKPEIPILILTSVNDRMVNPDCSRAIAKEWNVKIIEHPSAGHDLSCDDPEWILNKLKEFIIL